MKTSKTHRNDSLERFFVPDLSPMDRPDLADLRPRILFVAESPHISEITPEERVQRRPLCGAAGKKWWTLLGQILTGKESDEVSLERMLGLCRRRGFAILNAVQYPLDESIAKKVPEADPIRVLGFCKNAGPSSYKKLKAGREVTQSIEALSKRLVHPSLRGATIHCLGSDAEWFVGKALGSSEFEARVGEKIPHPSAWWRRGGFFGREAEIRLRRVFNASQ